MEYIKLNSLSNSELLNIRIKDLKLDLPDKYQRQVYKLNQLLNIKNILWRPHYWSSSEWFSPDGIGGFAYPFTLCHPKLIKLEKEYIGYCEGESTQEFFKLICHETGHAIDNAFGLRLKKRRQKLFGLSQITYPSSYRPKIDSDSFVQHLNDFYAQAHPDEDWAETFAVWLTSKNWKIKYKGTKALEKLIYLDDLMNEIKHSAQFKCSDKKYYSYKNDSRTVGEYLIQKRKNLKLNRKNFYSRRIHDQIFSTKGVCAASFITMNQTDLIKITAKDSWVTQKCLLELKEECKKNNYKLKYTKRRSQLIISEIIKDNYNDFLKQGRARVYM